VIETAPNTQHGTSAPRVRRAPPRRRKNAELRSREYLTEAEVERLIQAVRRRRSIGEHAPKLRDEAMVVLAFRHGLRVGELCTLCWDQIDFDVKRMHVSRNKNGNSGIHPLSGKELCLLRKLRRQNPHHRYVFLSVHGAPLSESGFRKMLARLTPKAGFEFGIHPHMLRHACGYKLANDGHDTRAIQDYLGHKNIQHTVRYTRLAPDRFKHFWKD
jgi:type 1 fimbriae regulatory protein FimB/type 1 fimbriae regulatory protein FimE